MLWGAITYTCQGGKASHRVELQPKLKLHPVFHVSCLKPYHADMEDPKRGESTRAPPAITTSFDKDVEYIMSELVMSKKNYPPSQEYLVKWKGMLESEASWEPKETLW